MSDGDFIEWCVRFLDGEATAEETTRLNRLVADNPARRAIYRDLCRQAVWIEEAMAGETAVPTVEALPAAPGSRFLRVAAAAMLIGLAAWIARSMLSGPPRSTAGPSGGSLTVLPAEHDTPFLYPFRGFPTLDDPDSTPRRTNAAALEVPKLDGENPRVLSIAAQLSGLDPGLNL